MPIYRITAATYVLQQVGAPGGTGATDSTVGNVGARFDRHHAYTDSLFLNTAKIQQGAQEEGSVPISMADTATGADTVTCFVLYPSLAIDPANVQSVLHKKFEGAPNLLSRERVARLFSNDPKGIVSCNLK